VSLLPDPNHCGGTRFVLVADRNRIQLQQALDRVRIELVPEITEEILRLADGKGSELGTGGMKTKLTAAQIVTRAGTDMIIANGAEVEKLYALLDGRSIGTRFLGKKADI